MLDQLECNSCDYKTPTYFDGEFYAYGEWNRRNDPDSQGKDPPHIARMREAVEEYDRRKK